MRMLFFVVVGAFVAAPAAAQEKKAPTADEVKALLQKGPITDKSWPIWRERLRDWLVDPTMQTDPAYKEAERFLNALAGPSGRLPPAYDKDHLAWYFLGNAFVYQKPPRPDGGLLAMAAFQKSLTIDKTFARAHRNLAMVIAFQANPQRVDPKTPNSLLEEADRHCQEALRLEPTLPMFGIDALVAQRRGQLARAAKLYEEAWRKSPQNLKFAQEMAECIVFDEKARDVSGRLQPLLEQFPDDGKLAALHALSLAMANRHRAAYHELERARTLGVDVAKILGSAKIVQDIEEKGKPGAMDLFATITVAGVVLLLGVVVSLRVWQRLSRKKASVEA